MKLLFSDAENNTCRTVVPGRKKTNKMNPTITLGFYLEAHSGPRRRVKGSKQSMFQKVKEAELREQGC